MVGEKRFGYFEWNTKFSSVFRHNDFYEYTPYKGGHAHVTRGGPA